MKKIFFILNIIILLYFQNVKCLVVLPFKVNNYIPTDENKFDVTNLIKECLISSIYTNVEMGTPPQKVTSIISQDMNTFLLSSELCHDKKMDTVYDLSIVSKKGTDINKLNIGDNDFTNSEFKNYVNQYNNIGILHQNISLFNTTYLSSQPVDSLNKKGKIDSKKEVKNITMVIKDYKENEKLCGIIGIGSPNRLTGGELKLRYIPSFINTLKKEDIINDYSFTFKFYYRDEGRFIIGAMPHEYEYYNNLYDKGKYRTIKTFDPNNVDYPWSIRFDSIHFKNSKNETIVIQNQLKCYLSPNLGFIIGEETYKNQIIENFFKPLMEQKICTMEKTQMTDFTRTNYLFGTNGIYEVIYCQKSVMGKNFPRLNFEFKEQNLIFSLTFNDLFKEIDEKYIFQVIFPENYFNVKHMPWYLGTPFYKAYQLVFNYDSKTIGLYVSKNMINVINENNNNKTGINNDTEQNEEKNNKISVIRVILEILFGICLIVVAYFIGKKINEQRKKRANELEDDYDYYANKNKSINDINEKDENNKNTNNNVEMSSAFGV